MDGLIVLGYLVGMGIRCGRLSIQASSVLLANRWPFSASSDRAEIVPRRNEREIVEFGHFALGFLTNDCHIIPSFYYMYSSREQEY